MELESYSPIPKTQHTSLRDSSLVHFKSLSNKCVNKANLSPSNKCLKQLNLFYSILFSIE